MAKSVKAHWTRRRLIAYLENRDDKRKQATPPSGEVFLTDVDGAILVDPEGYYLTDKQ